MAVEFQDYYKILGVARTATADEIKKAYRKMASKYHPDKNKEAGAEDKFKQVAEAYEVLKTPETRKRYDALGAHWKAGQPFSGQSSTQSSPFDFSNMGHSSGASGFSSFFESLFNQDFFVGSKGPNGGFRNASAQARPLKGHDLETKVEISLKEALEGCERRITLKNGGKTQTLQVKIPAGMSEGAKMRLKGQGEDGAHGGIKGDLYLLISLIPDQRFSVQGENIATVLKLSPWEAALGASIEVPTIDGIVKVKIPHGAQSGNKLRLKGKGLPQKSGHGDMLVELLIAVPKELKPKERELFEALKKESDFNPRSA